MFPVWILITLLPILGSAERFNCKTRILGAYYADVKSGCKAFHVCVRVAGGGIRDFRFFCPPGTLFHQEAQTCTDWGDDDPLACPADIYDGQFDLYKIGSGFDTKKISYRNREDEAEFGLQRAETGDRRLSQNNAAPNRADTDLRAAHSSDFFSGQRDRGRDETSPTQTPAPVSVSSTSQAPIHSRQSFRRSSTQRTFSSTHDTTTTPSVPSQPPSRPQYEVSTKRKLVRKRPIYVSRNTKITTRLPSSVRPENYLQPTKQSQQNYNQQQDIKLDENVNYKQNFNNYNRQESFQNKQTSTTTPSLPPQYREYKDEYVEVSRVTPKQTRYLPNSTPSSSNPPPTSAQRYNNQKEGLVELYNYEAQSTPGINLRNDNEPFKARNNYNTDVSRSEFARSKNVNHNNVKESPTTTDHIVPTKAVPTTTISYKNYNSVSYESDKNNYVSYSKQNSINKYPTTTNAPYTTIYTTPRPEPPLNLNTVAYNTNIGFNLQSNNYPESDEDDGQYHPPEGEDDGQYKPEIYDRELLAGAHSLNIAASGNRLPEDRKTYSKTQVPRKNTGKTTAPRPFKPAPTTPQPTTLAPETLYTTTVQSQPISTQRTFDYFQTYTTTSRPTDFIAVEQTFAPFNDLSTRITTTAASRIPETRPPRPTSRAPASSTRQQNSTPRPSTSIPHFARPVNHKEDNSYDYAYYDSDPGFVEYDHIEEFGRTIKKRS